MSFRLVLKYMCLEQNQRVFVYEDKLWTVKGRYDTALAENDEVEWSVEKDKFLLRLLVVRD